MNTKVIFVGNYKGGVGKTTTVLNLAIEFSRKNKKVLVLDLDPQSSLSEILVSNTKTGEEHMQQLSNLPDQKTLNYVLELYIRKIQKYHILDLPYIDAVSVYKNDGVSFDFIANSLYYRGGQGHNSSMGLDDLVLQMQNNIEYLQILQQYLKNVLEHKGTQYDFVIIDCPPTNNLLTKSAFLMSDFYIIPTILDGLSTKGVEHYIATVRKTYLDYCENSEDKLLFQHYFGDMARLLGIFYTLVRGTVDYAEEEGKMREALHGQDNVFFTTEISNCVGIARSTQRGETCKVIIQYEKLCDEILKRIEGVNHETNQ